MNMCVAHNKVEIINKTYLDGTYFLEMPIYGLWPTETWNSSMSCACTI